MKQILKYAGYILLIFIAIYLIWRFWYLIAWILLAAVISFVGRPLVDFYDKFHIRKWRMPHTLSTILALLTIVLIMTGMVAVFVPLILHQAETISKIDVNLLAENLKRPLKWVNDTLLDLHFIPEGQTIQDFMIIKVKSLVNLTSVTNIINSFFSVAGTIFLGLFSVFFIAFFFLKDENMFEDGLLLFVPVKQHAKTLKVVDDSKKLLIRYFIGILLEVLGVMSLITLGLWILGVKNAILIGFFGGIMNLIPYLGPVIGTVIGIILGLTSTLASGVYTELWPVLLKLLTVFFTANFIDNNVLVPFIYSSSVKAHPLEIFFIIIIGGSLAGIPGMLLAIPVYTVFRVIARTFFQQFRVVKKITETLE